jgi:hypothetical protein
MCAWYYWKILNEYEYQAFFIILTYGVRKFEFWLILFIESWILRKLF